MAYEKQNFVNGNILSAEQLNKIEDGIVNLERNIPEMVKAAIKELGNTSRIGYVTLFASEWAGDESPYSQVVDVVGTTENSQVDLTPSAEQIAIFYDKSLTFVTENDGGVVTVYAIGQKPENDYTIQVTITEVEA